MISDLLQDHIICIPNPLYHCFGSTMGVLNALSHKQTTVFPDAGFNPLRTLEVYVVACDNYLVNYHNKPQLSYRLTVIVITSL